MENLKTALLERLRERLLPIACIEEDGRLDPGAGGPVPELPCVTVSGPRIEWSAVSQRNPVIQLGVATLTVRLAVSRSSEPVALSSGAAPAALSSSGNAPATLSSSGTAPTALSSSGTAPAALSSGTEGSEGSAGSAGATDWVGGGSTDLPDGGSIGGGSVGGGSVGGGSVGGGSTDLPDGGSIGGGSTDLPDGGSIGGGSVGGSGQTTGDATVTADDPAALRTRLFLALEGFAPGGTISPLSRVGSSEYPLGEAVVFQMEFRCRGRALYREP